MKTLSFIYPFILFLGVLMAVHTATAQVNVTIRVLPPYQSRITEYASRPDLMLLTLTNTSTTAHRVQLTAAISGDNGVGAWIKPGYRSPQPIELAPGQVVSLNGSDIAFLFDHNQIQYTGISQADFTRGSGLLEGTYQLCIRALDYDTQEPLSPEEPMGCTQLVISSVEPPTIIQPFNEQELRADGLQAFPITWSTPPGSSPMTQYKVKLVEMITPRNPNDAMQSATTPPFFEETVNTNMLLYGPQYPQLTPGRHYALMVQAIDPFHTISFRNQGMSEVIAFTYGQSPDVADRQAEVEEIELYYPYADMDTLNVNRDSAFYARWGLRDTAANKEVDFLMVIEEKSNGREVYQIRDTGRLYYQSAADSLDFLQTGRAYRIQVTGLDPRTGAVVGRSRRHDFVYQRVADANEVVADSATLVASVKYRYDGDVERHPYRGKVYVYEALRSEPKAGGVASLGVEQISYLPTGNPVAEAETDSDGRIRFVVHNPKPQGHYLLALHNPYFQDPTEAIQLNISTGLKDQPAVAQQQNQQAEQDIGEITATVNSYALKLTVTKGYGYVKDIFYSSAVGQTYEVEANDGNKQRDGYMRTDTLAMINESLAGLQVRIYRKGKTDRLPAYEGGRLVLPASDPQALVLVAEDTTRLVTDDRGIRRAVADIDRLLWSQSASDLYYIKVIDPESGAVVIDQPFRFHPSDQQAGQQAERVNVARYLVNKGLTWAVSDPPLATLKGRLLYRWFDGEGGTHPLANKRIRLEPYYVFEDPETGKMTAMNGGVDDDANIVPVNGLNQETPIVPEEKFGERPPVVSASAVTETQADGSFEFKDFALYDSVFTYEGYYNLVPVVVQPPPFVPPALEEQGVPQMPGDSWDDGTWTPGGGFTFPDIPGGGLPDWITDLLPGGGGNGPGGSLPGGAGPGIGVGPGSPRMEDALAQAGVLSKVGLGVNMKNTSQPINTAVNSPKVVTHGGASALKVQQFHAAQNNLSGTQPQLQQPQGNRLRGPFWDGESLAAEPNRSAANGFVFDKPMKLHRTYRVVIEDLRYLSPDDNIEINPLELKDAGTLYSIVNGFKARVKVIEQNPDLGINLIQQRDEADGIRSRHDPAASIDQNDDPSLLNINVQAEKRSINLPAVNNDEIEGEHTDGSLYTQMDVNKNLFVRLVNHTRYTFTSHTNDKIQSNNAYLGTDSEGVGGNTMYNSQLGDFRNQKGLGNLMGPAFNDQYEEVTRDIFLILQPKDPIVAGRVLNDKGTVPIAGALVELQVGENTGSAIDGNNLTGLDLSGIGKLYQETDENGYFVFTGLPEGAKVTLSCDVPGYKPKGGGQRFTETRETIKKGEKWFREIFLTPAARVKGYVVNEAGEQVPALVKVEGTGQLQETECGPDSQEKARARQLYESGVLSAAQWAQYACGEAGGYFNVDVQAGAPARIIITPLDLKYFPDTVVVQNPGEGINDIGPKPVYRRLHRMNFVINARAKDGNAVPLDGTIIELLDTALTTGRTESRGRPMGNQSRAYYEFENISQHNFWVKVTPPEGSGFVPKEMTLTSHETKEAVLHRIDLEEGDVVWGNVMANGSPLEGAEVSVYQGDGAAIVRTISDQQGRYRILGLKPGDGNVEIRALAPEQTSGTFLAGKTQTAAPNSEVNFDLAAYDKLDVSSLLGYQVRITNLTEDGETAVVSGELMLPEDTPFVPFDEHRQLTFRDLRIRANTQGVKNGRGVPLAEPENDITLDNPTYRTRFDEYNVLLQGAVGDQVTSPLVVHKSDALEGQLEMVARIVDNSFDFPSSYLKFADSEFYFAVESESGFSNQLHLPHHPEVGKPPRYHFSDASGQALAFRFMGFDATSEVADNYYAEGNIHISPTIHAHVRTLGNDELTISMPDLHFNTTGITDVTGDRPITFKLEDWTVHVAQWKADTEEGGIVGAGSGNYIRTGAGLDLFFDTFRLVRMGTSDELIIDGMQARNIKLGGFHPISVYSGTNTLFGLDMKTGNDLQPHYILRMLGAGKSMAGRIENLPGFSGGLEIQAVTLVSNGQQYVSFAPNSREVNVHNVVRFSPNMLTDSEGGFVIEGNMDLGIPHMQALSGGFEFKQGAGSTPEMTLRVRDLAFELKGNVQFRSEAVATSDNGRKFLRPNELEIWGTVTEPGKLDEIPVRLLKKVTGAQAAIDIQLRDDVYVMKMEGDKMSMDVTQAWTTVIGDTWDYFQFTGTMNDGFASGGFGNKPMTFKVHGDIALENGQVELTQIETPFGQLELVFDWQKKEMRGSIAIQSPTGGKIGFPGGIMAKGMAEILLSPQGFYFMAAVEAEIDPLPLISPFSAGFVIGYHDNIPQEVFEKATQHMYYKTYPCGEDGVSFKGFMFAGRKDIIKPVDFSIDIPPVATADISLEVGADVTLYTNFANGAEIALVVGAFGKANLVLNAPMSCTQLSGSAAIELMGKFAYRSSTFVGEICASLGIATALKQSAPPFCEPEIFSFDKEIVVGAKFGLEASGSGVNPYFQLIRNPCSAEAPCSVN